MASSSSIVVIVPKVVHDAEYYTLKAQNGEKWAAEDKGLDGGYYPSDRSLHDVRPDWVRQLVMCLPTVLSTELIRRRYS